MGWRPTEAGTVVEVGDQILVYAHPSYFSAANPFVVKTVYRTKVGWEDVQTVSDSRQLPGDLSVYSLAHALYVAAPYLAYLGPDGLHLCDHSLREKRRDVWPMAPEHCKAWIVAVWQSGMNYGDAYKRNVI